MCPETLNSCNEIRKERECSVVCVLVREIRNELLALHTQETACVTVLFL
jgi:hypothetical protein